MFYKLLILLLAVPSALCSEAIEIQGTQHAYKDGKLLKLPMDKVASFEMMDKWLSQAFSGLMAAVASKKLHHLDDDEQDHVEECSKNAKSVPEHARCVVRVLDAAKGIKVAVVEKDTVASHLKRKSHKTNPIKNIETETNSTAYDELVWVGGFGTARAKRDSGFKIVTRDSYALKSIHDADPISSVARQMTKTVRALKNKETVESWRDALVRVKKIGEKAKEAKQQREELKRKLMTMIRGTPTEFLDPRKPLAMKKMDMEDEQHERKRIEGEKAADEFRVPMRTFREAVKIAMMMAGKNVTNFDNKTLKLASPRIMSIVPEQEDDSLFNLLSPSLFSLHEEGENTERELSLPKLLQGINVTNQDAWMDFVVEASGVSDTLDRAEKAAEEKKEHELIGENGTPLYLTKENITDTAEVKRIEIFEKLDKMYSVEQKKQMEKDGYAYLTPEQLKVMYGKDSPYHRPATLKKFMRMRDDPSHLVERDIRAMARSERLETRQHDIVGTPIILTPLVRAGTLLSQPVTLSPLVLSPIALSPAVLGPITLSPWVFIPLILSPRVLSPLILSPMIFSPVVLSPLVLHPLILTPGIFNPIILTPLVLSPLILSPQVFSPIILSPMVLNPLILNPMVGSPLILSPFVLSPIILSPQALSAVVLSPYALSPLVESKLIAAEVVLSPSWLS